MQSLARRLKDAREEAGLSQAQLAKKAGMSQQGVAAIESGRTKNSSTKIFQLARALGKPAEWLAVEGSALKKKDRVVEIEGSEFARIPIHDIMVAAGAGAHNYEEEPVDYYLLSLPVLRAVTTSPIDAVHGLQVMGDSMVETLHDRDWVLIDTRQVTLGREGIYALNFEGDAIIKRVSRHLETGAVTLISDNPRYPQQTIRKPERLNVLGRVILSIRRH